MVDCVVVWVDYFWIIDFLDFDLVWFKIDDILIVVYCIVFMFCWMVLWCVGFCGVCVMCCLRVVWEVGVLMF